ncbi:acyltransferase [Gordonia sinesedis]
MTTLPTTADAAASGAGAARHPDGAAPAKPTRRAYLHNVDLVRATTFSLVIFVHCLTQTTDEFGSTPVNTTSLLMHFTRNMFFALTGFVLMYQNFDKPDFNAPGFWRRRIKLVLFPYLAWSAIYWVVGMWAAGNFTQIPRSLDNFAWQTSWGLAGFQMYFLFVMLQVYVIFPAVVWLVRKTAGHHLQLLAASFVLQLGITMTITYWNPPPVIAQYWWHNYATFVPYQFFILYGAIAAVHRKRIGRWLVGKTWLLTGALATTAALGVGTYLYRVWFRGQPVHDNNSAFFPWLLPFLVVAIVCVYGAAAHWAKHWRADTPRFARVVSYAANRSFGLFLTHVLVLFFLLYPQSGDRPWLLATLGQPWGTIVTYLLTMALSLVLVEVLRRLPGSLYLTGRPRIPMSWPQSLRGNRSAHDGDHERIPDESVGSAR